MSLQINRDRSLTDVALTITHLLVKNLVTTYDAEKIPLGSFGKVTERMVTNDEDK